MVNYKELINELVTTLNFMLISKIPELDENIRDEIKSETYDALCDILVKYKLIEPCD